MIIASLPLFPLPGGEREGVRGELLILQ